MSYDRAQFLATVANKAQGRQSDILPVYRMVQAVGVVMQKLTTASSEWNRYLQLLQGQIERAEAAKITAQSKMNDPAVWDSQALAKLKSDILMTDAMILAWRLAMELPKAIIEGGGKAQEIIDRFEREHETAP